MSKQTTHDERQRRAAGRQTQPKKSKRDKRREKMLRRKLRADWGDKPRDWEVTMRLDGKRVTVEVKCPGPKEAAKLALWENREYVLANLSVDRVKVEVRHAHYGLMEKGIYEIPAEDWRKIPAVLDGEEKKPTGRERGTRTSAEMADCLLRRRLRIEEIEYQRKVAISRGLIPDPEFKLDNVEGLPEFTLGTKKEESDG